MPPFGSGIVVHGSLVIGGVRIVAYKTGLDDSNKVQANEKVSNFMITISWVCKYFKRSCSDRFVVEAIAVFVATR